MTAQHMEVLTEELSMEAFLEVLLPRLLPPETTFALHSFQGKSDLLKNLPSRLHAYSRCLEAPESSWSSIATTETAAN